MITCCWCWGFGPWSGGYFTYYGDPGPKKRSEVTELMEVEELMIMEVLVEIWAAAVVETAVEVMIDSDNVCGIINSVEIFI